MGAATRLARAVVIAALVAWPLAAVAQDGDAPTVLQTGFSGAVTPVIADHLERAVERAEDEGHSALLVLIDTPGGLDTAMREIVRTFLNARVPIVTWVAPSGARAASAGAVIVLASHVAAMAEGTNIGAATPVSIEGGDLGDKVVNDATAYVVAIAEQTGRDTAFARDIVRKGRSEPASRAARIGAIDVVESDRRQLLEAIDGRRVTVDGEPARLRTAGATISTLEMGWIDRVRQRLADPTIALLFMSIGTLAIVYEVANPGMGLGGIAGVILLVLALFSLSVLPVNAAGVLLFLLAAGLFVAELFVPGVGVLAAGGTIALVLSGIFLVRGDQRVEFAVLIPMAVVMFGAVIVAARLAWSTRRRDSTTGAEGLIGRTATVERTDGRRGSVRIDGSWWTVRGGRDLEPGEEVRVVHVDGIELMVERVEVPEDE